MNKKESESLKKERASKVRSFLIRLCRIAHYSSVAVFAKHLGVSKQAVNIWVRWGNIPPKYYHAIRELCDIEENTPMDFKLREMCGFYILKG